jgi:superfamily II DNA or RNA helicase
MPCGTGKSLAAFWIANDMKAKNILIAVPSLALLQQTLKVWTREFLINNIQPDWLCVCSDDTVKEDQDSFVSYTYDLGIEVTTDKDEIRKFLKTKSKNIKVIFTTYQSGRVTAQGSKGFTYDLGIMDEAHKTVGHQDKPMAHLLHQKNIKIKHRLFMTATERLFRANKEEYMSMDDERDYGKIIYELTFKDAINSKPPIISDYKIITFGISEPEIEEIYQDNKFLQVKKELKDITAREFATAIALRKAIKDLKITNAISFHSSIKRAVNFKEQQSLITKIYPQYESLKTFHVSGDMATSDRSSQMRLFEEGKGLMTNARCLTEGVDLPAIDCVCFTDPKRSKVDIVQAAGRALRLSPGKKFGYILIPIFIPADQDPETASKDNAFEEVVATVGALSTQDTRIAEYLRAVTEGRKPTGGSPVDGTISVNVLTKIDPDLFNKAIQLKIWDKIARVNYRSYEEAKKYAQSLNCKNRDEWNKYTKNKNYPSDIPKNPFSVYKNFEGWGEYLGSGYIANQKRIYLSYIEAKKYAISLNLKTRKDWSLHTKSKNFSSNLPSYPEVVYKTQFEGWGKFLGTGFVSHRNRKYRSYEVIKKYIKKFKFSKKSDWIKFKDSKKFPKDFPKYPEQTFKINKKWEGWGKFLGTGYIANQDRKYRSYEESKKYAKSLKLKSFSEWMILANSKRLPSDIPSFPQKTYKSEFEGVGVFLGTGFVAYQNRKYKSYKEAKKYAQSLNCKNRDEWMMHTKSPNFPKDIPQSPWKTYKKEFESLGIFLGNNVIATWKRKYKSYTQAKKYAQSLNCKNRDEWMMHTKSPNFPKDIPQSPWKTYKNEFEGMGIFLGNKNYRKQNFLTFRQAKKYARSLKIENSKKWFEYRKLNNIYNIPYTLERTYKKEWKGWPDFLGTSTKPKSRKN